MDADDVIDVENDCITTDESSCSSSSSSSSSCLHSRSSSSSSSSDIESVDNDYCERVSNKGRETPTTDIVIIDEDEFNDSICKEPQIMPLPVISGQNLSDALRTLQTNDDISARASKSMSGSNLGPKKLSKKSNSMLTKSHSDYTDYVITDSSSNSVELIDTQPNTPKWPTTLVNLSSSSTSFYSFHDRLSPSEMHLNLSSSLPLTPRIEITPYKDDPKLSMNVQVAVIRLSNAAIEKWCTRKKRITTGKLSNSLSIIFPI
jgi:hypothetical protein